MAIVVESTSSTTETSTSALVITKPSGLAVSDVLVAVIFERGSGGTPASKAGWDSLTTVVANSSSGIRLRILAKIADSSDVLETDFSFASSDGASRSMSGVLIRGSGIANDLTQFSVDDAGQVNSEFTFSGTISVTPPTTNSLLVFVAVSSQGTNLSGYSVSGTNPTWTERFETGTRRAVATAVIPSDSEITSISYDISGASNNLADHTGVLLSLGERVDTTGENNLVEATAVSTTQTGTADTIGTTDFTEATAVATEQTGRGEARTQWTNEADTTTTWNNETTS